MEFKQIRVMQSSPTIGAEIGGIELSKKVGEAARAELNRALLEYKVLFFREQNISVEQHIAFARLFGPLEVHPFAPHLEGHPEVLVIEHDETRPGRENTWHSDVTWRLRPSLGSVLRAFKVPEVGGDTLFADMYAAYEGLSEPLRRFVDTLRAEHRYGANWSGLPHCGLWLLNSQPSRMMVPWAARPVRFMVAANRTWLRHGGQVPRRAVLLALMPQTALFAATVWRIRLRRAGSGPGCRWRCRGRRSTTRRRSIWCWR